MTATEQKRTIVVGGAQLGPIQKADTREDVVSRMLSLLEEASEQGALWEPSEPRARESCYMLSSSGVRKMRVLPRIRREDLYALLTLFERTLS